MTSTSENGHGFHGRAAESVAFILDVDVDVDLALESDLDLNLDVEVLVSLELHPDLDLVRGPISSSCVIPRTFR